MTAVIADLWQTNRAMAVILVVLLVAATFAASFVAMTLANRMVRWVLGVFGNG